MIGFFRAAALWALGLIAALFLNKLELSMLSPDNTQDDIDDIKTTKKHFIATCLLNCAAMAASVFVPISVVVWALFIGCGMLLAPVFYNVFYVCIPKTQNGIIRLFLTITSVVNLVLIAYSLLFVYSVYINKLFM